jgi:adenine phosphoribosyltransferase
MIGGKVLGMAFLIELTGLNGRAALEDFDIFTLMEFA